MKDRIPPMDIVFITLPMLLAAAFIVWGIWSGYFTCRNQDKSVAECLGELK